MSVFKVEKGVPMPKERTKYPFASMGVGDSFFVKLGPDMKRATVASAVKQYSNGNLGVKFTTRKITEDGKVGVRVWRLK